jgi:HAD superfamily hydrolase (TIGR01509 family)
VDIFTASINALATPGNTIILTAVTELPTQSGFPLELPPGDFAAYIFDCDGTLADTMPTHYRAWQTALGEHAQNFPEAMFYELGGVPTARIVEILNERHELHLPVEATVAQKESIFLDLSHEIAAIEPVVALAKRYFGVKPLAVASGGHRRIVMSTLRALGIADLFKAIVTAEDYQRGKPSPDPFLEAALRLDVPPEQCLVFEDTATGIAAATAAGMQSVLVPPPRR